MRWLRQPPVGVGVDWSHPLARGLEGCWPLNEGGGLRALDLSRNRNHGTFVNTDPRYREVSRIGWAVAFPYWTFPCHIHTDLLPGAWPGITLSVWSRMDVADNYPMMLSYGENSDRVLELRSQAATGKVECVRRNDNLGAADMWGSAGAGWIHWVGVGDGTTIALFKNGALADTQVADHNIAAASSIPLRIGNRSDNAGFTWSGGLTDVRVWSRALSVTEVRHLCVAPWEMFVPSGRPAGASLFPSHTFVGTDDVIASLVSGVAAESGFGDGVPGATAEAVIPATGSAAAVTPANASAVAVYPADATAKRRY